MNWSVDWLIDWLIDQQISWSTDQLMEWLVDGIVRSRYYVCWVLVTNSCAVVENRCCVYKIMLYQRSYSSVTYLHPVNCLWAVVSFNFLAWRNSCNILDTFHLNILCPTALFCGTERLALPSKLWDISDSEY